MRPMNSKKQKKKKSNWRYYIPKGKNLVVFIIGAVCVGGVVFLLRDSDPFWKHLERVEIFLSAFTMLFAYMTWVRVKNRDSYFLDMQVPDDNEIHACLAIHIGDDGKILQNIADWCNDSNNEIVLKELSYTGEPRIDHNSVVVEIPDRLKQSVFIRADKMPDGGDELRLFQRDLQRALSDAKSILNENGVTSIHLLYKGPIVCGFYIGGFLDNKSKVYVYHYSKTKSKYEMAGELNVVTKNIVSD